jgi:DnaJ-domain-containing protein 1
METVLVTIFAFGLAFAVGAWLRSHLFIACLVGLGVAAPLAARVQAGALLDPLVVASLGALCGAFRQELAPVAARARGAIAERIRARRPAPDGPTEPEPSPQEGQGGGGSFFGGSTRSSDDRMREEAERMRRERERQEAASRAEAEREEWARSNAERERQENEAREKEERERRERQDAERRREEARKRQERTGAGDSGRGQGQSAGGGSGQGQDEGPKRANPPPPAGSVEAAMAVLGVPPSASPQAVKKAFRKLAMRWHPDRNHGDKKAEEAFKKIMAAYESLREAGKAA